MPSTPRSSPCLIHVGVMMVFTYQVTCNVKVNFTCLMWLLESSSYYISGHTGFFAPLCLCP